MLKPNTSPMRAVCAPVKIVSTCLVTSARSHRIPRVPPAPATQKDDASSMTLHYTLLPTMMAAMVLFAAQPAHAAFQLPSLTFEPNATEPVIDARTNELHRTVHHAGYINNTNAAIAKYPDMSNITLHELMSRVGTGKLPKDIETTIRNQGGGAWNHDLWWATLAPADSRDTDPNTAISSELSTAINKSFGGYNQFLDKLSAAARGRFGSGWAWLVVKPDGGLTVTDTANQDNPLMQLSSNSATGVPILGLDVWEHSYYLKYGPRRPAYVDAFPRVISWRKVSDNYAAARSGDLSRIIGAQYDRQS